jgi:hypothetical protein
MAVVPDAEDPERYHPDSAIRKYLVAKAASTLAPGPAASSLTPDLMGAAVHERWVVKTAADADAQGMTNQAPTPTTIAALTAVPVPALLPPDGRSDGAEKTVWQLSATLQAFGREADGDYHLVIADVQGSTMVAEIPNPGDFSAASFFAAQITSARTAFDSHFAVVEDMTVPTPPVPAPAPVPGPAPAPAPAPASAPAPVVPGAAGATTAPDEATAAALGAAAATAFQEVSVPVTLTGLGFFDFAHGQRGVAPNAIELHPVISIVFNG